LSRKARKLKVALIVNPVGPDISANLSTILEMANEAANNGAELVLFPEAAVTGLINNDTPTHDLPLGQTIPGPITDKLSQLSKDKKIYLAIGILERDNDKLYDSAVLLTPTGEIGLKYRRISPRWYGPNVDLNVYGTGTDITKIDTPLGSFSFMICGDLWDDELVNRIRLLKPDWILNPIARCFDDESSDQVKWDRDAMPEYMEQVKSIGITTLIVNYLDCGLSDDHSFGGAMVIRGNGTIAASFPLGKHGILFVNL
jgi:predicted amidohydrolase